MAKIIKNISGNDLTVGGVLIQDQQSYTCQNVSESNYFASQDLFISLLSQNKLEVYNDLIKITGVSNALNFLKDEIKDSSGYPISLQLPFASKTLNGKKLFKRIHGIHKDCIVGDNIFEFVIPYNVCKITGIEMINGESCDDVDLEVYDTPTGLISTIPNLKLNQFGFGVCVSKDYYEHKSEYDADLYKDMKIEVHYHAQVAKKIGINFILNELK